MPIHRAVPMNCGGGGDGDVDGHSCDLVMPGFRFHPTEEEIIDFYLRRKVEGKRFNVELITFLDLYRYDPWELPAMASIGEKEWYFYVPRDRKYRNGDRPNRVTTSGYWKATGADRMIRSNDLRPIGLKKTLVFYTGKAPKGVRTNWIMNEYRLPPSTKESSTPQQNNTSNIQNGEISLCRVYRRAGVEDMSNGVHNNPSKPSFSTAAAFSGVSAAATSSFSPTSVVRRPATATAEDLNMLMWYNHMSPSTPPLPPPPPSPPRNTILINLLQTSMPEKLMWELGRKQEGTKDFSLMLILNSGSIILKGPDEVGAEEDAIAGGRVIEIYILGYILSHKIHINSDIAPACIRHDVLEIVDSPFFSIPSQSYDQSA